MFHLLDPRWLLLFPLVSIIVFVSWVLWNVSRELRAEQRNRSRSAAKRIVEHFRRY